MKATPGKKAAPKKTIPVKSTPQKIGVPMQDIRAMAKKLAIPSFGKTKMEIIRALQKAEGNFDCYGRAKAGFCDQTGCLWHRDCLEDSAKSSN